MTAIYKSGQVAAALFSKKKSSSSGNTSLANLFAGTKIPQTEYTVQKLNDVSPRKRPAVPDEAIVEKSKPQAKKRKLKKEKENSKVETKPSVPQPTAVTDFPYQHESLSKKAEPSKSVIAQPKKKKSKPANKKENEPKIKKTSSDRKKEDEIAEIRPRRNRIRDKAADDRTVFVGNCPLSADKKVLKKLFREYGEIESVRFRCAPPADPDLPRRATVITKNFHDKCKSYVGYVVFKDEESAEKALEKNGFVLDELHLRVDIAGAAKKHDKKKSIFVGNLPFDVHEDEIRSHFADCGDIENVRIVRDKLTSLGKGICFLQFESKDSVGLALKLKESEFQNRRIRVMACTNKAKKKEEKKNEKKNKSASKQDTSKPKTKNKIMFAPSNLKSTARSSNFKSILQSKREKRSKKLNEKSKKGKKTDQITRILGEPQLIPQKPKEPKNLKKNNSKKSNKSRAGKGVNNPKYKKGKGKSNKKKK